MGKGEAQGKVILFGEHFVVHGAPAIAAGISSTIIVEVIPSQENKITTKSRVVEETSIACIEKMLSVLGIQERYEVKMGGDLRTWGGLGSSAAFCVALVKALGDEKGLHFTKAEINNYAYAGEQVFHGNPSGIDNTIATHGGVVLFKRGGSPENNKIEFIKLHKPLDMVVAFTGKYSETARMIQRVKKFKSQDEEEYAQLADEYVDDISHAQHALERGKLEDLGKLMNSNQSLLSELGVSDESNDEIVKIALEAGALGAKLTGGGGGGCCIALAKDGKHAEKIAEKIMAAGYECFVTKIENKH